MSRNARWLVAGGLVSALACGWVLGAVTAGDGAALELARSEAARQRLRAERVERALETAREEARRPRHRSRTADEDVPPGSEPTAELPVEPVPEPGAAPRARSAEPAPSTPAERRRRVDELRAQLPVWFDRGDGSALLDALREFAALAPEGRDAAMELALRINDDVNREGKLRLSDVTFYTALGDPAVSGLMSWALGRPDSLAGFRVMAAYSLPWTQPAEKTLEQFRTVLAVETEIDVQRALVANLARLKDPRADAALGELLADTASRPDLRAQVAGALIDATDDDLVRALERAAREDPDPGVRAAATASLVARDPPATGYLVTGTVPDGQASAAGLRPGDIVVSYNGAETRTVQALRKATADAVGARDVPVLVRRGGEDVTLLVRPGRLGVYGRPVEAAKR